jgi:hypothetical protein
MSRLDARFRRWRALATTAARGRARRAGLRLGRRPYPDEDVGRTPPLAAVVLERRGTGAAHALGGAMHADVAVRRAWIRRYAIRLADRVKARAALEDQVPRPEDVRPLEGFGAIAILLVIMVLEAALTKVVLDLLGASSRVTWAAAYAVALAQLVGCHQVGRGLAHEAGRLGTAVLWVLGAAIASTTLFLGLLRGLRLVADQQQLEAIGFAGSLPAWQAVGLFIAIQALLNGVALALGVRSRPGKGDTRRPPNMTLKPRIALARGRERRARAAYEGGLVRLIERYGEYREWGLQMVAEQGAVIGSLYDGLAASADPRVAAVHAEQRQPAVEVPAWLQEAAAAEAEARSELHRVHTEPAPGLLQHHIDLTPTDDPGGPGSRNGRAVRDDADR